MKKVLLKISRIIGWTLFTVFILLITVILLVRIPYIQNKMAQKAIAYLQDKINTKVELERIVIDFPKTISIEGLYLEDQRKDTLIYAGRIGVDASMWELLHHKILLNKIEVENATGNISRVLPDSSFNFDYIVKAFASSDTTLQTPADTTSIPWAFSIDDIELNKVKAKYNDSTSRMFVKAYVDELEIKTDNINFESLKIELDKINISKTNISYVTDSAQYHFTNLNLDASDIKYDSTNIEADIDELSLNEKTHNISLKKLSGFAKLKGADVELKDLVIAFENSVLKIDGAGNYESLKGDVTISDSHIAVADILKVQPHLLDSLPVNIPKNAVISLKGKVSGDTTFLTIKNFELKTLDSTLVSLNGSTKDLNFNIFTNQKDITTVLSDTLLPITPKYVSLKGNVKGSIRKPVFTALLATDLGKVNANGSIDLSNTDAPKYKIKAVARSIQAGKLAKLDSLGEVNFDVAVDGSGFTTKTMHTRVDLLVRDVTYNSYTIRDFKVNGAIDKFLFSGKASLNDENVAFELKADLNYNDKTPSYKAELDLRNLDLKGLRLSEMPLKMRLTLNVDLTTSDFKIMNGRLDLRKVAVFNGEKLYAVDSMLFASLDQQGHSKMSVRSDILSGDFEGSFNIFSVSEVLQHHFERYFAPKGKKASPEGPPQNFTFNLAIRNTDLLTEVLVPNLDPFTPGVIHGEFDSREHKLNVVFRMPKLKYNDTSVDSLVFLVKSDADHLRYFAKVENLRIDTIKVEQMNVAGRIAHDSIRTTFNVLDSAHEKKYKIRASIAQKSDPEKPGINMMHVHLDDSLLLNYSPWNVPNDNYLAFGNGAVAANHFEISKQKQKVIMLGDTRKDPAVTIHFEELELGNFTHIISGIIPASGELNGDFKFNTSGSSDFSSKLKISDLTVLQKVIGDLSLDMDHSKDQYNVLLGLRGNRTQLETKGTYGGPKGAAVLDLLIDIRQLNMEVVQAFSLGQLSSAEGFIRGQINVKGKPAHPDIEGDLVFADVTITPTLLKSTFDLKNEKISIKNDNITLNNFTISDAEKNTAVLKGSINIKNYLNPEFDLILTTKNFQVINTKQGDNELFYGKMKLNSTSRITGDAKSAKANVKVSFSDDTNFTYIVPTSEKGVLEAKGIVNFVDKDAEHDPFLTSIDASDSIQTGFQGVDVSAVIDLSGRETFNIVIDPITGDKLTVQGNSTLTFDMTTSGDMTLSGRYEISKGSYNLSFYNLVKRQFDITKGSSITWSGDPLNGQMDIRASNLVETSPLELVSSQISPGDPQANNYNQRLPFLVYINIKGMLLTPQISFNLDMPEDKRNAFGGVLYAKLQDINSRESDLNKQVFALIILKRFIADDPAAASGGGAGNAARTSVSRILSEQLNRLTQNVKGVQLTFDIKSYEDATVQGGTQGTTKAQLGVTKTLFGDRLVVKLSGNVDLEGQDAGSNNVTDYIGDLALEYKMTADGRIRVTGFRNSNFDMIDGELTETGAGLIYIKDYNTLRELFRANEK
ncbi:MAG: translocation/assembly module TamB domain-containing protein [Bacteroidota bacterium]